MLVKIFENLNFGEEFRNTSISIKILKISILVKIFKSSRFWSNFRKISIDVKLREDFKFGHNFKKKLILF